MIDNKTRNSVARAIAQTQEWAWGLDYDTCLEEDKIHARVVADAAITAYEAAKPSKWQPIETLEYSDDPVIGESEKVLLVDDAGRVWVGSLMFAIGKGLLSWGWNNKPTHWMPLPEPPSLKSTEGGTT